MSEFVDQRNYNEMIGALQSFLSQASEACDAISDAGAQCVDNMDEDEASVKSNAKLQACVAKFNEIFEDAQKLISDMEEELEEAQNAINTLD